MSQGQISSALSGSGHQVESFGDFEITGRLGAGGMGAVYRARQRTLDRVCALKVLPPQFIEDADYVSRFEREGKVAASLNHPNLVRVYSSGVADGSHYIAMELVEGEDLHQRIRRGALPMLEALRICADVARGLQCGWEQAQLIHRDIKPSNIYVSQSGEVKVGDLGLAKSLLTNATGLTQTGALMGTAHYMSPEQARGDKDVDFRADIYSLGCTLFETLTATPPYPGSDPIAIVRHHLDSPPPAILKVMPSCPIPLARLVGKMLKKTKHARHASYEELITEIEHVSALIDSGEAFNTVTLSPETRQAAVEPAKDPTEWGVVIAAVILLLGVGVYLLPKPKEKPPTAAIKPAPATVAPPAEPPIKAATPAAGSIDLLPRVDLKRAAIKGEWSMTPEGLALASPPDFAALALPYEPPEEYDFEVEFTPSADGKNPNLYLSAGGASFAWKLDAYRTGIHGFDLLDGKMMPARTEALVAASLHIETGRRYSTRVEVRRDGLRGFLDGTELVHWTGDFKRLSMEPGNRLRHERALGVGSFARAVLFQRIAVREVTGKGRLTADALPASAAIVATKDAPLENSLGMKFVPVPIIGGPTDGQRVLFSIWDTRVQDYAIFATETKRDWPKPDFEQGPTQPAVNVSWEDATAFCAWLTERERKAGKLGANEQYRLPSDHEWSCAVGIGQREDAAKLPSEKAGKIREYPWGTQWPPPRNAGNYASEELRPLLGSPTLSDVTSVIAGYHDGYAFTSPVGSYSANRFGLFDMGGNAWQWCEDRATGGQDLRVMRGASWDNRDAAYTPLMSARVGRPAARGMHFGGFRCVHETRSPASTASGSAQPTAVK